MKTAARLLRPHMVEEWDDERALGHGWFALLKAGWTWERGIDHRYRSFETKRDAYERYVYPTTPEERTR